MHDDFGAGWNLSSGRRLLAAHEAAADDLGIEADLGHLLDDLAKGHADEGGYLDALACGHGDGGDLGDGFSAGRGLVGRAGLGA